MKRRTFISLMGVMAAAGVLSLTGCSSKDTASSTASSATLNKLDSIQKSGKLVVAWRAHGSRGATTIPPTRWWAMTWRYPAPLPKSWA